MNTDRYYDGREETFGTDLASIIPRYVGQRRPLQQAGESTMSNRLKLKYQLWAALCGVGYEVLYTIFWAVFGHNLPPASPSLSAQDLAAYYLRYHDGILFGNTMTALVAFLWVPWTAQLTVAMLRIEGDNPVLTIIQVIGGIITAWVLAFCPAIWAALAFRTDIDPATLRTLNDVDFIVFNITYAGTTLQAIAAGLVGLADKSEHPVFPRWVSYWSIFTGLSFLPITAMPYFKTGPLAWDGLITFWALFGTFFVWTGSIGIYLAKDVRRRLREEEGQAPAWSGGIPAAAGSR
jgi:hypothetical protein